MHWYAVCFGSVSTFLTRVGVSSGVTTDNVSYPQPVIQGNTLRSPGKAVQSNYVATNTAGLHSHGRSCPATACSERGCVLVFAGELMQFGGQYFGPTSSLMVFYGSPLFPKGYTCEVQVFMLVHLPKNVMPYVPLSWSVVQRHLCDVPDVTHRYGWGREPQIHCISSRAGMTFPLSRRLLWMMISSPSVAVPGFGDRHRPIQLPFRAYCVHCARLCECKGSRYPGLSDPRRHAAASHWHAVQPGH